MEEEEVVVVVEEVVVVAAVVSVEEEVLATAVPVAAVHSLAAVVLYLSYSSLEENKFSTM